MIGVYDFCGHYEWTFEWLRHEGGEELVAEYWEKAISADSQRHARALIMEHGFEGMLRYWTPVLEEEGGVCVTKLYDGVLRADMQDCPSKGFLLRNGLEQYHDYCNHCIAWINPIMQEAGFRIDHQHNHRGQCWWEYRLATDTRPASAPGELSGVNDVRLLPMWNPADTIDSFLHDRADTHVCHKTDPLARPDSTTTKEKPMNPVFTAALATPLGNDDNLHNEGLEALIGQQRAGGINSFLVGGSMGAMQLLPDATYRDLMQSAVRIAGGECEILAGAGDTSLVRTRQRIEFLNTLPLDGVVVLAPFLMAYSQDELVDYYRALADASRAPLYLYDLPVLTKTKLTLDTVLRVADHPNIAGIKCSDEPGYARQMRDMVDGRMEVIIAAPILMDVFMKSGFERHLDGFYCLCPRQIAALGHAAAANDWERAEELQRGLNRLMRLIQKDEVWRPFTALMNHLGVPGHFKPMPHRDWDAATSAAYLGQDETRAMLEFLETN